MIGKTNCHVFSQAPKGTPLGELAEGTLINIQENGQPVQFYVAKVGYEPNLNGPNRVLCVRKDVQSKQVWDTENINAYADSDIDTWFNNTYKSTLSSAVQTMIGTTTFPYTPGNGNYEINTLSRAIFGLSSTELGFSSSSINAEGTELPICTMLKRAMLNGEYVTQWGRSPKINDTNMAYGTNNLGQLYGNGANGALGARPCFTLPSTALVDSDLNLIEDESSPVTGATLADLDEGTLIKIPENGVPIEFYLAKHDYEPGLNGAGRQLIVRKDCYDLRKWHDSHINAWASCSLLSWLNDVYKGLLDSKIQELIGTTKYYFTPGNGITSVSSRADSVFMLSLTEFDDYYDHANVEGSALPIASSLKIAYRDGTATTQWTRSPDVDNPGMAIYLTENGKSNFWGCPYDYGSRPTFTLPADVRVDDDLNIIVA